MTLEQYLDGLSPKKQKDRKGVWRWAVSVLDDLNLAHVWKAVTRECRLPEDAWDDLFGVVDAARRKNLEDEMTMAFRGWKLHGKEIANTPTPKGRAMDLRGFSGLMERTEEFDSETAREAFFNARRKGDPPSEPYWKQLSSCELGRHNLIWSTFQASVDDPFEGLPDAPAVRTALGLPASQGARHRELVLLVYVVPTDLPVRYPTVADAYAGPDWNPYFECSNPGDSWGYTKGDRPEVVHEVIEGGHLIQSGNYGSAEKRST